MEKNLSPIISAADAMLLAQQPGVVVIDARTGANAKAVYESGHLAGAVFVDMDKELADIKENAALGGRHPLPVPTQFWEVLKRLGITPSTHVLVYDDKNASNAAARFWWIQAAKPGYISVGEYYRKEKKMTFRLEQLAY